MMINLESARFTVWNVTSIIKQARRKDDDESILKINIQSDKIGPVGA
jgi:hypothetical protein